MKLVKLFEEFISLHERRSRLDSVAGELARAAFKTWVADHKAGKKKSSYSEQIELENLEFDFDATIYFRGKGFNVMDSTGADARDYDEEEDLDQTPFIQIDFEIEAGWLPGYWSEIYMHLMDVTRHEIEHITQGGDGVGNYKAGKPYEEDQDLRMMITNGILPKHMYLLLPKEVDANLQGIRFEAKKRKISMIDAINTYLDTQDYLTPETRQEVIDHWRRRAKQIGGIPNF